MKKQHAIYWYYSSTLCDEVSQVKGAHNALRGVGGLTCAGMSTFPRACPERRRMHLSVRLGVCLGGSCGHWGGSEAFLGGIGIRGVICRRVGACAWVQTA